MKALAITLALAGLASTATLNAQIASGRVSTAAQGAGVNGSWTLVSRDGGGNQIYERRMRDSYGNIVVQRARRDRNGNMSIFSNTAVNSNNTMNGRYNGNTCNYSRSSNSVGDIVYGRANANPCEDVYTRDDGAWYQAGRGANNSSIYERRTQDRSGNLVIQRARRNRNGTFTIVSTRVASTNDRQWKNAQKHQQNQRQQQDRTDNRQNRNRENHR